MRFVRILIGFALLALPLFAEHSAPVPDDVTPVESEGRIGLVDPSVLEKRFAEAREISNMVGVPFTQEFVEKTFGFFLERGLLTNAPDVSEDDIRDYFTDVLEQKPTDELVERGKEFVASKREEREEKEARANAPLPSKGGDDVELSPSGSPGIVFERGVTSTAPAPAAPATQAFSPVTDPRSAPLPLKGVPAMTSAALPATVEPRSTGLSQSPFGRTSEPLLSRSAPQTERKVPTAASKTPLVSLMSSAGLSEPKLPSISITTSFSSPGSPRKSVAPTLVPGGYAQTFVPYIQAPVTALLQVNTSESGTSVGKERPLKINQEVNISLALGEAARSVVSSSAKKSASRANPGPRGMLDRFKSYYQGYVKRTTASSSMPSSGAAQYETELAASPQDLLVQQSAVWASENKAWGALILFWIGIIASWIAYRTLRRQVVPVRVSSRREPRR